MIQKFMTKRNRNGNRRYLTIDHGKRTFDHNCRYIMPETERIEVTTTALNSLDGLCIESGYLMTDYIDG